MRWLLVPSLLVGIGLVASWAPGLHMSIEICGTGGVGEAERPSTPNSTLPPDHTCLFGLIWLLLASNTCSYASST